MTGLRHALGSRLRLGVLGALLALLALPLTARAQTAPLPPDQVPAGVTAVIAQRVALQRYTYSGDCQQVTTDQSGTVCSLTTAQADGTWSVGLYPVFTFVPLGQFAYDTFTVTPDQAAAATPPPTPSPAPSPAS